MTEIFNRITEKIKRRRLRKEATRVEQLLWLKIRKRQLNGYKFRRQFSAGPYIVDFYCPKIKLAIEVDGGSHFTKDAAEYDAQRQKAIETTGIRFLRFTNLEVYQNINDVLETILRYLP